MRDQPQAWQYRSNDATESATDVVPSPREPADDTAVDSAARTDSETRTADAEGTGDAWTPPRSAATDGVDEPNLDAGDIDEAESDRPVDETESDADRRDGTFSDTSAGTDESAEAAGKADDEADEAGVGADEPAVGVAHVPDPMTGDGDGPGRVDGAATDRPTGETWTDRSSDEAPATDRSADEGSADDLAADETAPAGASDSTAVDSAVVDSTADRADADLSASGRTADADMATDGAAAGDRPFDQETAG
ncbi:MAG TPA: hypothetical protein VGJ07_07490, partial [Rugosimonospora sp.]